MRTASLLLCAALACGPALAAPMRILAVEEPPASYIDAQNRPAGFAVDVLREIQRRVGNADPVTIEPETRVYDSGLRLPDTVLLAFSRTPEREASFYWIARIIHKPWVFYGRAESTVKLSSLADVQAIERIGVVSGDVRARWLAAQGAGNLLIAQSQEQALQLLLSRRVDVLFTEPQAVAYYCHQHKCAGGAPRALWSPRASDVYIMLSRRGTSPETARRWTAAADAMKADGTFAAIARRWVAESAAQFGIEAVYRDGVLDFCTEARLCGDGAPSVPRAGRKGVKPP